MKKTTRGFALVATGAMLGSLLVMTSLTPVSADDAAADNDAVTTTTGSETVEQQSQVALSFVKDVNDCEAYHAGLDSPVEISNFVGDVWTIDTPVDFPEDELLSAGDTPLVFTGVVTAGGQPVANAVVGTLMLSNLPAPDAASPEIIAATCAITNAAGEYSVRVLNVAAGYSAPAPAPANTKVANLGVAPPLVSASLAAPTLGSTSTRVTAASPTSVDFALQNANVNWGSAILLDPQNFAIESVTFPTSAYCVAADATENASAFSVCGISRGFSFSADVTAVDVVEYAIPRYQFPLSSYLRLYINDSVDELNFNAFEVSELSGDFAPLNGRWSDWNSSTDLRDIATDDESDPLAILDGAGPDDEFIDIPLGPDNGFDADTIERGAVAGPTVTSEIWRNAITVPSTDAESISVTAFHKHRLGSPGTVTPGFRFITATPFGGNSAFTRLTTPGGFGDVTFLTESFNGGGGGGGGGGNDGPGGCGTPGTGNVSGIVVTALTPSASPFVDCGWLSAQPFKIDAYGEGENRFPGWAWDEADGALQSPVDEQGHFGFNVPSTGIYRLNFRPNSSQSIPETNLVARFTVGDGAVSQVHTCASFSINPEGPADVNERCESDWVLLTALDGRYPLLASPANVFGQVLLPNNSPVAESADVHVNVETPVNGGSNWYFSGNGGGTRIADEGKFLLHLPDGQYRLSIDSPRDAAYSTIRVYLRISTDGGVQSVERCTSFNDQAENESGILGGCTALSPMSWASPLQLQYQAGDLVGQVDGASYFWVEMQKKSDQCDTCYQPVPGGSANAGQSGQFALTFNEAGEYKLFLNPPNSGSSGATRSEVLVTVEIDGSTKTLTVTQNNSVISPVNGVYTFTFNAANFTVRVADPQDNNVANSWVNLQRLEDRNGRFEFTTWVDAARTDGSGLARMSINTSGYYRLVANNPTPDPYPELVAYLKVVAGSPAVFYRCSAYQSQPSADRSAPDDEVTIDDALACETEASPSSALEPFEMQFVGADFRGQVVGFGNFWVEMQKLNLAQCENCFEWIGGTVANQNGVFGLNFAEAGTYKLVLNPPWNDTSGATRTEVTVVVTGSTAPFSYAVTRGGVAIEPTEGTYLFSLSSANFAASVKKSDGTTAEPYPNASFERWNANTQQFEWSSLWANGNASGNFSASLSDGTWKITARPGFQSEGSATPAVVYVRISSGEVSAAKVAITQACAESAVLTPCTRIDATGNPPRYPLTLGSPNFTGFVGVASGIGRGVTGEPSSLADAVAFSWIEVQPWNVFEQQYRWSNDVPGANTSSTGRFATSLPAGNSSSNPESRYLVTVNPRPQDAAAGRSRGSFRVQVVEGAVVCEVTYEFCTAGAAPESGRFDLYLSGANLTGTVKAGTTNVPNSQVRAERWNGQWFDWVNLWAQTGGNGRFALNLDTAGTYKLTAEAPTWNSSFSGYANVSRYVRFDGTNVCEVDDQNDTTCNAEATASLDLTVALAGANVRGSVTSAAGTVRNGWVNVMRYNSTVGWWEWVAGVPVNNSGAFSISLSPSQDGDTAAGNEAAGVQQRFKLEVMPPWGNSSLTRKEVQLWVGDVDLDGVADAGAKDYLVCSKASIVNCTEGDESTRRTEASTLPVVLSSGNVTGTVTTDGTTGMPNAWINVEKWMTPSWSNSPMWQWVEVFANTNQVGVYNLDLADRGAGYYRVTANPGWNNPDNLTRTSAIVLQDGDGDVCSVTVPSTGPTNQSCDDAAANPYDLDIQLAGANLVGTLKNGSENVGFAWVGFLREQNNAGLGDASPRSNTWYEWLGGANTSATGGFGLRIDGPGRYQLEVNPPWNSTLTRFAVFLLATDPDNDGVEPDEIRICASKSESNTDCADNAVWSSGSNSQISFPAANVAIRVCGKDDTGTTCTAVPNAWVNVFSGFDWIGGANTNNLGLARFSLPAGTAYRFEANPNWSNPDGSRVETSGSITVKNDLTLDLETVTVGGAVINKAAGQIDMRLGSPNVSGRVFYLNTLGQQAVMPWAYVGVRQNLGGGSYTWLPGASADATGTFRLALADGDYTLTAYPNPNLADRAPASIEVSVASGAPTCTGPALVETCSIDFDAAPKNVAFELRNMGTFTRTLYVYDSSDNLVTTVSKAPSTGTMVVNFALPNGTYRLRVQALNTVGTDGTTPIVDFDGPNGSACRSYTGLVIADGAVVDMPALDAWATNSFLGDDEGGDATGLECKTGVEG